MERLYSDNGTNMVGAFRQLEKVQQRLQCLTIEWLFIPPAAPHFGGLWEAGVKSVKTHLKKVHGTANLTYEEMSTVLIQVEAVLNSRPLCPFTNSVEDLSILTPNHFLTGQQYVPIPEDEEGLSLTARMELLQKLYHDIAQRYKNEYICESRQSATKMAKGG